MSFFQDFGPIIDGARGAIARKNEGKLQGLRIGGEHVLGVSNEQVPHEDGDLERSGAVSQDEATGLTAISYDTDYAVVQHEVPMQHDAGRTDHFLMNALVSEREQVLAIVRNAIKQKMGL